MNKIRYASWTSTILAASLLMSSCQLFTGYQKIDEAESAEAWAGNIQPVAGEVNIACVGTYHCEIAKIDKTLIIAPDSHEPVNSAMLSTLANNTELTPLTSKRSIKIVPLSDSAMPGFTNYYARVLPAKREVHVNFYPENNVGYVERFAMIHDFADSGTYQLRAYQEKASGNTGSLLESASPEPLCIELYQGNVVKRQFCKQLGSEHQGEFVETSMTKNTTKENAEATIKKAKV